MRVPRTAGVFRELSIGRRSRHFTLRLQAVTARVTATAHTVTGWVKGTPETRAYTPQGERVSGLYTRSAARHGVLASKLGAQDLHAIATAAVLRQSDRRCIPDGVRCVPVSLPASQGLCA